MTPAQIVSLAIATISLANRILAMIRKEDVEKDVSLTAEQKKEYLDRITAAQAGVTKIE